LRAPCRTRARSLPVAALALLLAGCGSSQDTLQGHSRQSKAIAHLFWVMFVGAWIVFGFVLALLVIAFLRRRRRGAPPEETSRGAYALILGGGLLAPALTLSALFGLTISTIHTTQAPAAGSTQLTIEVTGHQWFWDVRYPGTKAATANEIHIPVNTRVVVVATTKDVIHSFWVPELDRKIDMIPGRTNTVLLDADRVGVYRGQCAEFCGLQHAHMGFLVYVDPPDVFRRWLANMAKPARPPAAGGAGAGARTFVSEPCSGCHTIRGTAADGKVGPDLTHLASRETLAADTIPNREEYLAGWIRDPQHVKPGNRMPAVDLSATQVQDVVAYLESLK